MLIIERMPLTGANLIFCERTRDRINRDPRRRAEVIIDIPLNLLDWKEGDGECYVLDRASPIMEKNFHRGKRILEWDLDGGSGEA